MALTSKRPVIGGLVVPYMVDERVRPIDFKRVHDGHVRRCAEERRCGICGKFISNGAPLAFAGPDDGRRCFADPWMHVECAQLAMQQCPFLAGRRGWRKEETNPLLAEYNARYEHNMAAFVAPNARSHRDEFGHWHFEALGTLKPA
jgi:hypothetical protein